MTTFYLDGDLAADTGDGTSGNPWKNLSHIGAQSGSGHTFNLVGDFRGQTMGTNGCIEINGNSWTITGTLRNGLKPRIGGVQGSNVTVSSAVASGGTVTITTSSSHGFVTNETVSISGLSGSGTTANGYWLVLSTPTGTTFTFALAGTFTDNTGGTTRREALSGGAIYNNSFTGLALTDLDLYRCKFGVRNAGADYSGETMTRIDGQMFGQYFYSGSGSSNASIVARYCTATLIREDCWNFSGTSNQNFDIGYCTGSYIGYNFDGVTVTLDLGTGPGDFVTCHAGGGASNYGTVHHCYASYGTQGFFNNVNTSGTNIAYANEVHEFAGSGFQQSGGGSMLCINNVYFAPINQALDNTTARGMFKFNPSSGVGGTFQCYFNTGYTDKGSIASFTTAAAMFIVTGGITDGSADQFIFKNNRWLSNGTAPFGQVVNQNSISITNLVCASGTATVTATGHGLSVGCRVRIIGVTGGAAGVNNTTQTVLTKPDANTFTFATAVSGTSTNGSSQRVPMLVSDYNVFSGDGTASRISYGATSASYTKTLWQQNGYDTNSTWNATTYATPPRVLADFDVGLSSIGIRNGVDLSGLGYSQTAVDFFGRKRNQAAATRGAVEPNMDVARGSSGWGFGWWNDE